MQCETEILRMSAAGETIHNPSFQPTLSLSQHLCPASEASILIYAALMLHKKYSLLLQVQSKVCLCENTTPNTCTTPSGGQPYSGGA